MASPEPFFGGGTSARGKDQQRKEAGTPVAIPLARKAFNIMLDPACPSTNIIYPRALPGTRKLSLPAHPSLYPRVVGWNAKEGCLLGQRRRRRTVTAAKVKCRAKQAVNLGFSAPVDHYVTLGRDSSAQHPQCSATSRVSWWAGRAVGRPGEVGRLRKTKQKRAMLGIAADRPFCHADYELSESLRPWRRPCEQEILPPTCLRVVLCMGYQLSVVAAVCQWRCLVVAGHVLSSCLVLAGRTTSCGVPALGAESSFLSERTPWEFYTRRLS